MSVEQIVTKRMMQMVLVAGLTLASGVAMAGDIFVTDDVRVGSPRRYLTTYMAHYPFGLLREDYTPLGAPGVSKANYFGRPMLTATLHTHSRKRYARFARRAVVSVRY